jgi:hypothetical protein
MPGEFPLVVRLDRIGLHEPLGQPDHAELEAAAQLDGRARAPCDFDAAAADIDDDRDIPRHADAVDGGLMDEARLFGAGDQARPDAGLLRDCAQELAAVRRFTRRARRDGDHFVDAVRFGQAPEFRQDLERRVYRLGREFSSIEAARAEADHFFLAIDHVE